MFIATNYKNVTKI